MSRLIKHPLSIANQSVEQDNPQFVRSTGNRLYVYTRTDQADSRRGYRYKIQTD